MLDTRRQTAEDFTLLATSSDNCEPVKPNFFERHDSAIAPVSSLVHDPVRAFSDPVPVNR
jgi:hypothetical protein